MDSAPVYVENGVFLIGDSTLLPSHLMQSCSLANARGLLRAGVDPTTAWHAATKHLRANVLRAVKEIANIDVESLDPREGGTTALLQVVANRVAISTLRWEVVRVLVELGANVSARGRNNETVLSRAVVQDEARPVDLFLELGSDVNMMDGDGNSTFHISCRNTRLHPYLEQLLKNGADPNLLDGEGKMPLHVLVSHQEHERLYEAIKLVVSHGGHIDFDSDGIQSPREMLSRTADGRRLLRKLRQAGLVTMFAASDA